MPYLSNRDKALSAIRAHPGATVNLVSMLTRIDSGTLYAVVADLEVEGAIYRYTGYESRPARWKAVQ